MPADLPQDLLNQFKEVRIPHRNYDVAERLLRSYLTFANDGTIILLLGPSKAGKSTIVEDLLNDHPPVGDKIPMIVTDATTIGSSFSMLHMTFRLLAEVRHPLFSIDNIEEWKRWKGPPKMSETYARILLENGVVLRECMFIAVDECQQLVSSMTENKALHVIESFKCLLHLPASLRKKAKVPVLHSRARRIGILSGGYEMLDDGLTSDHFNNRIAPVHVSRYKDTRIDRLEFARALRSLDEMLKSDLRRGGSLVEFESLIYHGSFGRFGKALNWVLLAVACKRARGQTSGNKALKVEHFTQTQMQITLEESLASIIKGEERMEAICKDFAGFEIVSEGPDTRKPRARREKRGHRYKVPEDSQAESK